MTLGDIIKPGGWSAAFRTAIATSVVVSICSVATLGVTSIYYLGGFTRELHDQADARNRFESAIKDHWAQDRSGLATIRGEAFAATATVKADLEKQIVAREQEDARIRDLLQATVTELRGVSTKIDDQAKVLDRLENNANTRTK